MNLLQQWNGAQLSLEAGCHRWVASMLKFCERGCSRSGAHCIACWHCFLHFAQINESDGPMLLAGSADGAVRVWRSYMLPGNGPCCA
jgi:hypothetical protein